ncbi:hypothetical protein [Moraxella bovis]|nr:hypothetical protein [Moraxella bovis]
MEKRIVIRLVGWRYGVLVYQSDIHCIFINQHAKITNDLKH